MDTAPKPKVAIMVGSKGRGSNMSALVAACREGKVPAEVALVVASGSNSDAEKVAQGLGIPSCVVLPGERYGERLAEALIGCEWLCLAGFLRILPAEVLAQFPNRVLNIHPSLLPKFGGKGMYGHHVHEAVIAAGESESGCTVHFVNEKYDDGAIILQRKVSLEAGETPESLAAKVLKLEHELYAEALTKVIHDRSC
jgi:formyltetrahydrofolate-dependent phosphoribosylglycinamide formyltransferase